MSSRGGKSRKGRAKFVPLSDLEGASAVDASPQPVALRQHLLVLLDTVDHLYEYSSPSLTRAAYTPIYVSSGDGPASKAESVLRDAVHGVTQDISALSQFVAAAHDRLATHHSALRAATTCESEETRAAVLQQLAARVAELGASVDSTMLKKTAAFETELVQLDAVLESTQRECSAVRAAASALSDSDLLEEYAALVLRMENVVPMLRAVLPRRAAESPVVTCALCPTPLPHPVPEGYFSTTGRVARIVCSRRTADLRGADADGDDHDDAPASRIDEVAAAADSVLGRLDIRGRTYSGFEKGKLQSITLHLA
jgi:hypothetical protein